MYYNSALVVIVMPYQLFFGFLFLQQKLAGLVSTYTMLCDQSFVCGFLKDVIEISDNEEVSNPSSGMSVGGEDSAHQSVRAIRCDDGSYLVEPSGSSPIHTFTRLQDMDRNERSQYQNQYQYNKGSSSRKRQQAGMPSKSLGELMTQFQKFEVFFFLLNGGANYLQAVQPIEEKIPRERVIYSLQRLLMAELES